ncbi:MAG: ABC transporter permease [Acidaminococcales bacterium]|jgi:peptide/nickel transport system permease protein|nr:ABC transporter permease [Acidaminococcales bacterium]
MGFVIRRLLAALPVLFLVSVMVFMMLHMLPGDPATVILGDEATPEAIAALRAELGLDKPLLTQYLDWASKVFHGNLGRSLLDRTPVTELILQRLPATAELIVGSFLVALAIALPSGIIAASKPNRAADHIGTAISFIGMSIPHFWLGMMFIMFFAARLGWFPASGYVPFSVDPAANLMAMIMPMVATGFRESAILMRMIRSSLLEVMSLDYIRTARAKGLPMRRVILGHALKNSLIPVVTASGIMVASLLGGLVITESIFSIPGYGKLIIDAIFSRDYTTVQGAILISAVIVVGINFIVDVLYTLIDPRIKLGKESN